MPLYASEPEIDLKAAVLMSVLYKFEYLKTYRSVIVTF